MAVDDQAASTFRPYPWDDLIDHRLLEFRCIHHRIPRIGVREVAEGRRIDQMDTVRIDGAGDLVPLVLIKIALLPSMWLHK